MYHQKPLLGELPDFSHPLTPTAAWIMNEGSGNKIYDLINGNHGTFGAGTAAPSWVPEGLDFDGSNDHIISPISGTTLTTFSFVFWFLQPAQSSNQGIIQWAQSLTSGSPFFLLQYNATPDIKFYCNTAYRHTENISNNTIYQAAITHNGSKWFFYLDGKEVGSYVGVRGNQANANDLYFGNGYNGYWEGKIYKAFLYVEKCLTTSQISQLFYNPFCWLAQPMEAELMYAAPPIGAIMNQFQRTYLGADLYDGAPIT